MIEGQLDIFEILSSNKYEKALEELSSYEIDEYYRNHFKGKSELLWKINNTLSNLDNYKEYHQKLYKVLKEYCKDVMGIEVYKSDDCIRIQSSKSRSNYPVYCLEMLNKEDR